MAIQYSIQKMVSDGTLSTIALGIQYLQRNDIYIRIAGEDTPQSGAPSGYTWSFINNTTLKILPVVPNGVEVVVYRRTDVDAMYNVYSQNAQFDEATIDENNQQLLYIAQEYLEQGIPGASIAELEYVNTADGINYYRFKLTDGSYTPAFGVPDGTDGLRSELSAPGGAGLVGGLPVFVTATKYAGGATTSSTSNDAAIIAAINDAIATGSYVYWPAVYEVQGNIPNFHSVRHDGPGGIKRGTDTFRVHPLGWHTNNLHCSPTGSSVNDGITSGQPMANFQQAFNALKNYGPMLDGTWQIIAAAGTYTINSGSHNHTTPSKNRVVIKGPAVGASPAVPTCIVDGGGNAAQYMHGINCDGIGVRVLVQDIKFQNFTESSGFTRIGLLGANGADLHTVNVHTFACSWVGIDAKECEQVRIQGGILDGNNTSAYGFVSDSSHTSFGYGAGGLAGGPLVKRCLSAGVYWSTGSQGHCDFVTFEDNTVGLRCAENSRADTVGNNYKRNTVAKRAETGGYFATGGAAEIFNNGTADANGTNLQFRAFSGDSTELIQSGSGSWIRIAYDRVARSVTGTATTTLTTPYTIPAYRLKGVGKSCRVHVMGAITCTAGSVINVVFGGMTVALSVPGASTGLPFEIDVELFEAAGAGHRANGKLIQGLNQTRMGASSAGFISTEDQAISVSCTLANSTDTITLYRTDVYLIG